MEEGSLIKPPLRTFELALTSLITERMGFGLVAVSLVMTVPSVARASSNEPAGINLGGTSFMDGFGRIDPGFVYQQYFQVEHYGAINDQSGHQVPMFQGTDINAVISLNQLIYVSPYHLLGGALGVDALLPVVDLNASFAPTSPAKLSADRGLAFGDLTWGAFLQMQPVVTDARPVFAQRFEFDVISPIGQYNHTDDINPSSGFWSLNPFWAMTFLPTPNTEWDWCKTGGQAATAVGGHGSLVGWNFCPNSEPSVPL